ncbi:neutral zinc metallopeptidase [Catelliglobosispora koreensis]|uniref:neutral zinc metallopeptidase n=1 Tax=Catelliglobosispora koreensis TaxID=129052 RepID=UPI00037527DA|nr:neutral zinc metallopeptidase [Catelliglobosispora koreensis]
MRAGPFAAIVAILLAACFVEPPRDNAPPSPGQQEDGTTSIEEFEADLNGAVNLAEDYWAAQFQASRQRFVPLRSVAAYRRAGEVACGQQAIPENNAVYCPAGDFIAYDVDWAVVAFQRIGDAFLYYLLGHEYAHAIQARLGVSHEFTIQFELQADCMAGAYIGDSVRSGGLRLDDGDLEEFRAGLIAVGDDPGQPWFAPESHGTGEQRYESFASGYSDSLGACGL